MKTKAVGLLNSIRVGRSTCGGDVTRINTEDGASLALKHYRPERDAPFNTGGRPVLLMPGAIASYYEFDVRTPEKKYCRIALPDNLPDWAANDIHIRRDPMKLYSLAYYLHSRGHDVWLVNFRGQGRGSERSFAGRSADVDHFGIYDMKAAVENVRNLTGKRPVYIGHSLGGIMALIYLQGAYQMSRDGNKVNSDPRLAKERNAGAGKQAIAGFVNLDGPCVPFLFGNTKSPFITRIIWYATALPVHISLKIVTRSLPRGTGRWLNRFLSVLWKFRHSLPARLEKVISILFMVNPDNIDPEVLEHVVRTAVDVIATEAAWQLIDSTLCGELRSSCRRDDKWRYKDVPQVAGSGNFYSYSNNMSKITVPSLFLADATVDVTEPVETRNTYDAKARHQLDEFRVMPGTAHIDLVFGLRAPFETYPTIGAWIERLEPE